MHWKYYCMTDRKSPAFGRYRKSLFIVLMLVLGLVFGIICNMCGGPLQAYTVASTQYILGLFIRVVKMIIVPLVMAGLISGLGNLAQHKGVGRLVGTLAVWIVCASLISLLIGIVTSEFFHPGRLLSSQIGLSHEKMDIPTISLAEQVAHIIPSSIIDAMARNEIMQVTAFSLLFGLGLVSRYKNTTTVILQACNEFFNIMLRVTEIIMKSIPLVVFASTAMVAARSGYQLVISYFYIIMEFYVAIMLLVLAWFCAGFFCMGRDVFRLSRNVVQALILAFSTGSSEAAYSELIENLEEFGIDREVSGFLLPLCYSFNMDGAMMFQSFSVVLIADAYGIHLGFLTLCYILGFLFISSKGMAIVPRGAIIILGNVLPTFGLPPEGILLLLGVDHFFDMARTAASIYGMSVLVGILGRPVQPHNTFPEEA
ncbi:dicarboxylate/amino acid:cation symporter [Komagataeibacter melomenusus]